MSHFQIPVLSSRDVEIFSSGRTDYTPDDKTLLIIGGRAPDAAWTSDLISRNSPAVWAADSGVSACRAAGASPSVLVGDKDSAAPSDWNWAVSRGAEEKIYARDKDATDFQLALSLLEEAALSGAPPGVLMVSGCFGGVFDHLMSVFFTLASSGGNFFKCMIDEREGAFFIASGESAALEFERAPEAISLLPVTETCDGVSVSGVKWPLGRVRLERRYPWTVSNETLTPDGGVPHVDAECADGTLALYWRY